MAHPIYIWTLLSNTYTSAYNKNDRSKTSLNSIIDTVVHNSLTIRTQTIELFQTTVTATHTSSQKQ